MINERAMVPSDILTASNGKTIEIVNTDAEGRLTLADALVYADKELQCERIIELSTLTGAVMVSLGTDVCGLWTDSKDLASEIADASKRTNELSWRMPLVKKYNTLIKSNIADIKNSGARYGGAIAAGKFVIFGILVFSLYEKKKLSTFCFINAFSKIYSIYCFSSS